MTTKNSTKMSYKTIVSHVNSLENITYENKDIKEYDTIDVFQLDIKNDIEKTMTTKQPEQLPIMLKTFLIDFIDVSGELTTAIHNTYRDKGIANDLKLEKVLDCFESSLQVHYIQENDFDNSGSDNENYDF